MDRVVNNKIVFLLTVFAFTVHLEAAFAPRVCKKTEWACDEGTCIETSQKCNGAVDCPDGTDETFLLCRNQPCSGFQCVYGGCVPSYATCNGVKDCVDNSDELIFKCRNETTYTDCISKIPYDAVDNRARWEQCKLKWRTCKNGQVLDNYQKCDGNIDCMDGSDETLETCATDQRLCSRKSYGQKFRCNYGACVDQSQICNGVADCVDGSDEIYGLCNTNDEDDKDWACNDGTRIKASKKCDGTVNCPDASDETFIHCRNNTCPNKFRCVYGGCVPNSAICNGVQDCIDNTDELLTRCRNEQTQTECTYALIWKHMNIEERQAKLVQCAANDKKCDDGQILANARMKCDGRVNCKDGSDEDLATCATDRHNCVLLGNFRCQHGACIDKSKVCNKKEDCADGSDELPEICNVGRCVLPEYPNNGKYEVLDQPDATPGQDLQFVKLKYSCEKGYELDVPDQYVSCVNGSWARQPPKCIIQCYLTKDPSIVYLCHSQDPLLYNREQECGVSVPDGMIVRPQCREPNYHYPNGALKNISCVNGQWDAQLPICPPNCGLVTPEGTILVVNGISAKRGELPWHAAIYKTTISPYEQICGGSLITNTIIISAAHCFWFNNKLQAAERYAAALGKIYRPWNEAHDMDVHRSNISRIIVPYSFHGIQSNFQDDIALVVLVFAVRYQPHLRPICVNFNEDFEKQQLAQGKMGKVSGWGFTHEDGKASPILKVAQLSYIDHDQCYLEAPDSYRMYLTNDKFCAGYYNESTVCQGDSGGGLVFPSKSHRGEQRYFLRGIVSSKEQNQHACNINAHTTFTKISKHKSFIEEHCHILPYEYDAS